MSVYIATCGICKEMHFSVAELLDHLRLVHPEDYASTFTSSGEVTDERG